MEQKDFSSVLDGILSNPEMLGMISSIADKLKNTDSTPSSVESVSNDSDTAPVSTLSSEKLPDMLGTLAPLLSLGDTKQSVSDNNRACLLRALKPYLSSGRCEAIEYIIKFSKISDVLKNLS